MGSTNFPEPTTLRRKTRSPVATLFRQSSMHPQSTILQLATDPAGSVSIGSVTSEILPVQSINPVASSISASIFVGDDPTEDVGNKESGNSGSNWLLQIVSIIMMILFCALFAGLVYKEVEKKKRQWLREQKSQQKPKDNIQPKIVR
jgi:preprotein translocase subunit SecG